MLVLGLACFPLKLRCVMRRAPPLVVEISGVILALGLFALAELEISCRVTSEDRHRSFATFVAMGRFVPFVLQWRLGTALLYGLVGLGKDLVISKLRNEWYGDDSLFFDWAVTGVIIMAMYYPFSAGTRNQYLTEQQLADEKQAFSRLLAMQNDSVITVDSSGIIVSTGQGLDSMVGRSLEGQMLANCLSSDEERERIQSALASAKDSKTPVLMPTTLLVDSEAVKADFFIVHRGSATAAFMVGVRCVHEVLPKPSVLTSTAQEKIEFAEPDETGLSETGPSINTEKLLGSGLNENIARLGLREHWLIQESHLCWDETEVLGQGGFGVVQTARFHGSPVAVKTSLHHPRSLNETTAVHELRILRFMRHPNIVSFLGASLDVTAGKVYLVFELIAGGHTLQEVVSSIDYGSISERGQLLICDVLQGVGSALCYMHAVGCLHRDIKPSNVLTELLHLRLRAKLTDFGLSHHIGDSTTIRGTTRWMAPEALGLRKDEAQVLGPSADIFSYGVLIYYTVSGHRPHSEVTDSELRRLAKASSLPKLEWPATTALPGIDDLAERCMQDDPSKRPCMTQVLTDVESWCAPHQSLAAKEEQGEQTSESWMSRNGVLIPGQAVAL
eukprot:TRINITY_DN91744_c0_g1_i1.p1 TRINITY_DN91744_c0_g1~~TRINITY_DN91744_c0_g1_i1.p1  ORF type:complete len:707 (-),score=92.52 TRINITY_DN91744_c0_g1_i1:86-1933(-)